jgi:hypothetical protein
VFVHVRRDTEQRDSSVDVRLSIDIQMANNPIEIDLHQLRVSATRRLETRRSTSLVSLQEPSGIFELIEVVGNGTYGQVYKVCCP